MVYYHFLGLCITRDALTMQSEAALAKAWADFSINAIHGYPLLSRNSSNEGISLNGTMGTVAIAEYHNRKFPINFAGIFNLLFLSEL